MKFKSEVQLEALNNATVDTDKFLVSDSSTVKYRTGAQVLSDIGGQAALTNPITGTGTLNFVSKFTGATSLGNSLIYDDGTNVGIGTTTPLSGGGAAKWLTVNGTTYGGGFISSVNGTQKGVLYYDNASETFAMYAPTSVGATIHTNGSERMRITSAGDVGIGTLSPGYKLDVNGVINTNAFFRIGDATTIGGIGSANAIFGAGGNDFTFYNPNATNNVFYTSGTERMRIASGGNVGIGTSSPAYKLVVQKTDIATPAIMIGGGFYGGPRLQVYGLDDNATAWMGLGTDMSGGIYEHSIYFPNASGNGRLSIGNYNGTTYSEKMCVINSGNVGIGTTSPSEKLHISGNTLVTGTLEVDTVNNGVGDFLTRTAGGIVTRRTAAEVRSDIGAQAALTNPVTGTGTLNFVSKFTSTGSTLGNSQIFDNGTSVGIGTSGPLNKVDIVSSNNDSFGAITVRPSNQTQTLSLGWQGVSASLNFIVNTGAVERMRITSAGNVGIGTTSPGDKLDINGITSSRLGLNVGANSLGTDRMFQISGTAFTTGSSQFAIVNNPTMGSLTTLYGYYGGITATSATNSYAMYLEATSGTITNKYGVYQSGTSDKNYFAGNVGIGTTSPSAFGGGGLTLGTSSLGKNLIINSSANGSTGLLQFVDLNGNNSLQIFGGSTEMTFYGYGNRPMSFYTNDAERMRITSSGNVGIGTTSPSYKLSIQGSAGIEQSEEYFYFNSSYSIGSNARGKIRAVGAGGGSGYGGDLRFSSRASNNVWNEDVMTISNNGNVGIGTTSPSAKLDVRTGVVGTIVNFTDGIAQTFQVGTTASGIDISNPNSGYISFSNTTERMRITSSGFVGIGTTAPTYRLQVSDAIASVTAFGNFTALQSIGGAGYRWILNNDSTFRLQSTTNGFSTATTPLLITSNGAVGVGVTPTNTAGRLEAANDIVAYSSSDKRWKINIKNIDSPLEKISQINGVEFDWIEDEPVHGNKGHDIGVIAQEIEQILPDAVQTRESGMKAVKYEKVIPLLIEAIKEQQKQIEELKQLLNGITN